MTIELFNCFLIFETSAKKIQIKSKEYCLLDLLLPLFDGGSAKIKTLSMKLRITIANKLKPTVVVLDVLKNQLLC